MPERMRMGFLSVMLSEVEESHFLIPNVSTRFGRNSKRFLDFARNDKCFLLAICLASRWIHPTWPRVLIPFPSSPAPLVFWDHIWPTAYSQKVIASLPSTT